MKSSVSLIFVASLFCGICIIGINCDSDSDSNKNKTETYACSFKQDFQGSQASVCMETEQKDTSSAEKVCSSHTGYSVAKGNCAKTNVCKVVDASQNLTSYWSITQNQCTSLNGQQEGNLTTTWLP